MQGPHRVDGGKQTEEPKKRRRNRIWGWKTWSIIGVAVILAVSVAACGRQSKISLFGFSTNDCTCQESSHKLSGIVEDCCCEYKTVDTLNNQVLHPLLQDLVRTPFFRYFKTRLWCDCPFWPDDGMCRLRDCSVCECPDNEFPKNFKLPAGHLPTDDLTCQEGKPQAIVDRTLDKKVFRGWMETDNPWTYDDERDNSEMTYVNLLINPERYTGYTGPSAQRIWDTIYKKHCLKDLPGDASPEHQYVSGYDFSRREIVVRVGGGTRVSCARRVREDKIFTSLQNLESKGDSCHIQKSKLWKKKKKPISNVEYDEILSLQGKVLKDLIHE